MILNQQRLIELPKAAEREVVRSGRREELDPQEEVIRMVLGTWFADFNDAVGNFPDNYIVFDLETTGTVFGNKANVKGYHDLITQIGHCVVKDRKRVANDGLILNWYDPKYEGLHEYPDVMTENWLSDSLDRLVQIFEDKGRTYQVPEERMRSEGADPLHVLNFYYKLFMDARAEAFFFVGHNAHSFDGKFLRYHFQQYLDKDFKFGANELLDTGMVEKASQMPGSNLPWPGDTIKEWSERIYNVPMRVKWNLDQHCADKYRLMERFQLEGEAHDAGFDCLLTHHLFETYREIAAKEAGNGE